MSLSPIECMASSALLTLASSTGGDAALQQHNSNQELSCRPTAEKYVVSGQLPKHHANVHREERPFNCDVCDKTFRKGSDLKRHLRIHTGERPYVCETCSRAFAEAGSLHRHERCHTGEKPFACSVCNQLFCRAYNARKHTLKHHPSEGAGVITVLMLEKAAPIKLKERSPNLLNQTVIDREMDILARASVSYKDSMDKALSPPTKPFDLESGS